MALLSISNSELGCGSASSTEVDDEEEVEAWSEVKLADVAFPSLATEVSTVSSAVSSAVFAKAASSAGKSLATPAESGTKSVSFCCEDASS